MGFPIDLGGKTYGVKPHRFLGKPSKGPTKKLVFFQIPPNSDGPVIQWWQPLRQPGTMGFCLELQDTKIGGHHGLHLAKMKKNGTQI